MKRNWSCFVVSLRDLLDLIRHGRRMAVRIGPDEEPPDQQAWDECNSLLGKVLVPTDEYAYMKCRLMNGQRYYEEGEVCTAAFEVGLALKRAIRLRRLYT